MGDELVFELDIDELVDSVKANFAEPAYLVADRAKTKRLVEEVLAEADLTGDLGETPRYRALIKILVEAGSSSESSGHRFRKYPHVGDNPLSSSGNILLEIAIRIACISPQWFFEVKRWAEKLVSALNEIYRRSPEQYRTVLPEAVSWPVVMSPGPDSVNELHALLRANGYRKAVNFGSATNIVHMNEPEKMLALALLRFVRLINENCGDLYKHGLMKIVPLKKSTIDRIFSLKSPPQDYMSAWQSSCAFLFGDLYDADPARFERYRYLADREDGPMEKEERKNKGPLSEAQKIKIHREVIRKAVRQSVGTLISHDHHGAYFTDG